MDFVKAVGRHSSASVNRAITRMMTSIFCSKAGKKSDSLTLSLRHGFFQEDDKPSYFGIVGKTGFLMAQIKRSRAYMVSLFSLQWYIPGQFDILKEFHDPIEFVCYFR